MENTPAKKFAESCPREKFNALYMCFRYNRVSNVSYPASGASYVEKVNLKLLSFRARPRKRIVLVAFLYCIDFDIFP